MNGGDRGSPPFEAGLGAGARRALMFSLASLALCVVPLDGAVAWARFGAAAALAAAAALSHRDGAVYAAVALLVTVGLKDGLPIVPGAHVGVFHVVLAAAIIAAGIRVLRGEHRLSLRLRPLEWALGLLPLAGLWSLPMSLAPGQTLASIARLLMLWAAALVVSRSLASRRAVRTAVIAFVAAAVPLALFAFAQWLAPDVVIGSMHRSGGASATLIRPAVFYMDPNFLAAHLVLASLAALWLVGSARRWWLPVATAVASLGAVAITFSRSAWVSAAAGLAVLAAIGNRRVRLAAAGVVVTAALGGVALLGPAAISDRALSVFETQSDRSNMTRMQMARSTLAMIADRPVFGTGLKAFDVAFPDYQLPGGNPAVTHPHQVPLAVVAETGVAGALALALLLVTGLAAMRSAGRDPEGLGGAVTAGIIALGAGSLFQYFLYFEPAWLYAGLLAAVAAVEADARTGESGT